jgi:hypothetical protein
MRKSMDGSAKLHGPGRTRAPCRHVRYVFPLLILLLFISAKGADAQVLRGTIIEESSGAAVAGAVVSLIAPDGSRVVFTVSDSAGAATLRPPRAGTYTVRVERIGIQPFVSAPVGLTAVGDVVREFVVSAAAVSLPQITADVDRRCQGSSELIAGGRALWEEIRKSLEVVAWASHRQDLVYHVTEHTRSYDGRGVFWKADSASYVLERDRPLFESIPADSLLSTGFVQLAPDGRGFVFFAPDAAVITSGAFLEEYCFYIRDGTPAGRFGLAFEPAGPQYAPPVSGTLHVDSATLSLRNLEFEFLRFPFRAAGVTGGGTITFDRLAGEIPIITGWRMRIPELSQSDDQRRQIALRGFTEIERRVTRITDSSGAILWSAAAPR